MTPFQQIYDAFLAQIQEDEWASWEEWERQEDWRQLMFAALPWFKFPRVSLEYILETEDYEAIIPLFDNEDEDEEMDEEINEELEDPNIIIPPSVTTGYFIDTLSNFEIQIIVAFMKTVWLNRMILSWENLKPLYQERDFSAASMLKELKGKQESQQKNAEKLEARYYRSVNGKPFNYSRMAG